MYTVVSRRSALQFAGAAITCGLAGCSANRNPPSTDATTPVEQTPRYSTIASTPSRPDELTKEAVESYVTTIERKNIWNGLHQSFSTLSEIRVHVKAQVDVQNGDRYFVIVERWGEATGADGGIAEYKPTLQVYYVDPESTVRFGDVRTVKRSFRLGTPSSSSPSSSLPTFRFRGYNADVKTQLITVSLRSTDSKAEENILLEGFHIEPERGLRLEVDENTIAPGQYEVTASTGGDQTDALHIEVSTEWTSVIVAYIDPANGPVLNIWPSYFKLGK